MAGALAAYLWAVLAAEPAVHDPAISAWQWFWGSYGDALRRGSLFGAAAGVLATALLPSMVAGRES